MRAASNTGSEVPAGRCEWRRFFTVFVSTIIVVIGGVRVGSAEGLGSREAAQLTLLHLADVYQIAPVNGGSAGGLARVATLKKELEAEGRSVLVTLGGDFLSPSVASSIFKGRQMTESLHQMGLDLATLGNSMTGRGSRSAAPLPTWYGSSAT
jgi:5'-nucleotidase